MKKIYKNITFIFCVFSFVFCNAQNTDYLISKAKKGDPSSQMFLGLCYRQGKDVMQNDSLAFYWFSKSARQGLAEAQVMLGNCYLDGIGVEKDSIKAYDLYNQASESGASLALDALGDCYYYGIAVERDVIRARYFYSKAAKRGYKKSKMKYDKIRYAKNEDEVIRF